MITSEPRNIDRIFAGIAATDGAGVRMTRVIATPSLGDFDPFLLLDEFRSDDPDDYIAGFPDHPHRGFETVTYMLAGAMAHRDSQGNAGLLGPGSVQWMTAGRGIVHSEMPQQENGLMWGFQLWVNLPASKKMSAPRYQEIDRDAVPLVEIADGVSARLIAGELSGSKGPIGHTETQPLFYDLDFTANATAVIPVPSGHNVFVYPFAGRLAVADQDLPEKHIGLLTSGNSVSLKAGDKNARCLLIGGKPLNEPIARHGPFVMNTEQEIRQAFTDYESGNF